MPKKLQLYERRVFGGKIQKLADINGFLV